MEPGLVLIVDDDDDVRFVVSQLLTDEGYLAHEAANGVEAIEFLRTGARPCVILLDLTMPVMDGWAFRQVQLQTEEWAAIPVIVLSAAGQVDVARLALAHGEFIAKPMPLDRLLDAIEKYCRN